MRVVDGRPVLSVSDLADFLDCEHLTTLGRRVLAGDLKRPYFADPTREILEARGRQHEQRYLDLLRARLPGEVIAIPPPSDAASWPDLARQTTAALSGRADRLPGDLL